jgi:hypothetical protein
MAITGLYLFYLIDNVLLAFNFFDKYVEFLHINYIKYYIQLYEYYK